MGQWETIEAIERDPVPLRQHLTGHSVTTAYEQGWSNLSNGELLKVAEEAG